MPSLPIRNILQDFIKTQIDVRFKLQECCKSLDFCLTSKGLGLYLFYLFLLEKVYFKWPYEKQIRSYSHALVF